MKALFPVRIAPIFLIVLAALAVAAEPLVFEAEDVSTPTNAWTLNRFADNAWTLWTTDEDAAKKWSGGKVLASPKVEADRSRPEEGAPMLHVVIPNIPKGVYNVKIKHSRALGASLDGKTWTNVLLTGGSLGKFNIQDGKLEFWVDDRYATPSSIGRSYFDAVILTPPSEDEAAAMAPFDGSFEKNLDGWKWIGQANAGSAEISIDAKEGKQSAALTYDQPLSYSFESKSREAVGEGEIWEVSAWVKVVGFGGVTCGLKGFRGADAAINDLLNFGVRSSIQTAEWKMISGRGLIPAGITHVAPTFYGNGKVRVLVDGVTLKKVDVLTGPKKEKAFPVGWAKERVVEKLGRGLIGLVTPTNTVYLSWRLRVEDGDQCAFNVYRSTDGAPEKLNTSPVQKTTDFIDAKPRLDKESRYTVKIVANGKEGESSPAYVIPANTPAQGYISFPIEGGSLQKVGIGDLDGDGEWDYVLKTPAPNVVDPYHLFWKKSPDTYKLEAYSSSGKLLWKYNLGWSIEMGVWYSPFVVWDLDGDGKTEVMVKIGEDDPRDSDGRVIRGGEWCLILDGLTGKEKARIPWPSREGFSDYNFVSRNQCGIAYLDGKTPSLILARGTYTTMKAEAWEYKNGAVKNLWRWTDQDEGANQRKYYGQGAHTMISMDVDGDGKDEVILGSCALAPNGTGLWTTGMGHCDAAYLGKIDPFRPGLQIYYNYETAQKSNGLCLVDARNGQIIWGYAKPTVHIHNTALCADIDPFYPGMECYGGERDAADRFLHSAHGLRIADEKTFDIGLYRPSVYWDADLQREIKVGATIRKFSGKAVNPEPIAGGDDWYVVVADILGDWREEIITYSKNEMRIYSTTIPAMDRRPTLMQDPLYRRDVAHKTMGYPASPMTTNLFDNSRSAVTMELSATSFKNDSQMTGKVRYASFDGKPVNVSAALQVNDYVEVEPKTLTLTSEAGKIAEAKFSVRLKNRPPFLSGGKQAVITAQLATSEGVKATDAAIDVEEDLPIQKLIIVQAENFSSQSGGEVKVRSQAEKPGTMGTSFSHWDSQGHAVNWKVKIPENGNYLMLLRYSSISEVVREVTVDDKTHTQTFDGTGGFGNMPLDWQFATVKDGAPVVYSLSAGEHTIRLVNADGVGMNLDYIAFIKAEKK